MNRTRVTTAVSCMVVALGLPVVSAQPADAFTAPAPRIKSDCANHSVADAYTARPCTATGAGTHTDGIVPAGSLPRRQAPHAELIPLALPTGSVAVTRPSQWASGGGVTEMWMVPFSGPDALTAEQLVGYLRTQLPVAQPYRQAGLNLDWHQATPTTFTWHRPGGEGPQDRLEVAVLTANYIQITVGRPGQPVS